MYVVRENYVDVIGGIWMPYGATAAYRYELQPRDIECIRARDGSIGRQQVSDWLDTHAGDFSSITDFRALIDDAAVEFDWQFDESEGTYCDCMFPDESTVAGE